MRLRNMLKICLVFWESEPQYAYKRYAYKKTCNYGSAFIRPFPTKGCGSNIVIIDTYLSLSKIIPTYLSQSIILL